MCTAANGLDFYDACWCAGTGCGGHVKLNPAFAAITSAGCGGVAHPCGTCGARATSYYIAGTVELYGCAAHPVLPHNSAAIPWGSRFGTMSPAMHAQHTYTPGCDGLHQPGPCPPSPPAPHLVTIGVRP